MSIIGARNEVWTMRIQQVYDTYPLRHLILKSLEATDVVQRRFAVAFTHVEGEFVSLISGDCEYFYQS